MPQVLTLNRAWTALILVAFCLPLFAGLGQADLETDEAIYSFAVDRILEIGDWLVPKSSTSETEPFLEKPPLKFWLVAASMKAGLLPHTDFGMRAWDAAFAGIAFLYVFAIGSRLAGPVCGAVAVLLLFVHAPLLLDHGIRGNNMESPLFLGYCGGLYHVLQWATGERSRERRHAMAAGLYFVLGFMTKFVASIFLPMVAGIAVLLFPSTRERLFTSWRTWLIVAGVSLALVAPWFVFAFVRFGDELWQTMFGAHVYARFTTGLNPEHLQPWTYYYRELWAALRPSGVAWIVPGGLGVLLVQTIRKRWFDGALVLVWAAIPLALISSGSSKLYHYAFPFLPAFTLAAGYVVGLAWMLVPSLLARLLERVEDGVARVWPGAVRWARSRTVAIAGLWLVGLSAGMILWSIAFGSVRLSIGRQVLLRSSGIVRPLAVFVASVVLLRRSRQYARLMIALVLLWWTPVTAYTGVLSRMRTAPHPLRTLAECVQSVDATSGTPRGLFVDTDSSIWHPIYYYFRRIRPWTHQVEPSAATLARHLSDPSTMQPALVHEPRYHDYLRTSQLTAGVGNGAPAQATMLEYELLLPGPYAACSAEAALRTAP